MRYDADHHCPPPCQGHVWRPVDRPNCDPHPPEATDHCGHSRSRERDCYTPGPPADEYIPGRLSFDLYLLKGHRQARAAYAFQCGQVRQPDSCHTPGPREALECSDRPHNEDRRGPRRTERIASPQATDQELIQQLLTLLAQRGSLIDLLA